jgi:hypothetical protein
MKFATPHEEGILLRRVKLPANYALQSQLAEYETRLNAESVVLRLRVHGTVPDLCTST